MIVHCGEALVDFIPDTTGDGHGAFRPAGGGSAYNSAIAGARLGAPSAFLGKISTDFLGDMLYATLRDNGVNLQYVARSDQPTTLAFVQKNDRGEARYAFFANDAADRNLLESEIGSLPPEVAAIHVGSIALLGEPTGATVEALAVREGAARVVSFDPNVRPGLVGDEAGYRGRFSAIAGASTIVKISDEDLQWYDPDTELEAAACALLGDRTQLVVLTRGSDGVSAYGAFGDVSADAVPTRVADTIGAGDSFHAALLAWLNGRGALTREGVATLSSRDVTELLSFAANVASVTCSRAGADPPRLDELPADVRP